MRETVLNIGELCGAIGAALALISPVVIAACGFFKKLLKRLDSLEKTNSNQQRDIENSLAERRMLLSGIFACLDGLHQQGCNGQVTAAHRELEEYLINVSHRTE